MRKIYMVSKNNPFTMNPTDTKAVVVDPAIKALGYQYLPAPLAVMMRFELSEDEIAFIKNIVPEGTLITEDPAATTGIKFNDIHVVKSMRTLLTRIDNVK